MKTYGVAIVGTGNVARGHLKAVQDTPQAELVALGDYALTTGQAWAAEQCVDCGVYDNLEDLLADERVDIVILTTPNFLHAEQTIQAARAGKHILIEKPVALNLEELHRMQAAVREAGVSTLVSFVLRWNDSLRISKNLIREGAIGDPFLVETTYWHSSPRAEPGHWMTQKATAGSVFLMGGCHAVDAARWLVGADVVEVSAYGTRGSKAWMEYEDTVTAVMKFANGAIGRVSASMGCVMPYAFDVTIMGTQGTIRDDRLYSHLFPGQTEFATIPSQLPDSGSVLHHPFTPGMQHFIECLEAGKDTDINLESVINVHEACLAVDCSVAEGRPVQLPLRA